MDIFDPKKRSEIMAKISNKNTKPELQLRHALFSLGLRYRLHAKDVMGKPDILFRSARVAVFVDGNWWHGHDYEAMHSKYPKTWQDKIKRNIDRDKYVTSALEAEGWVVMRFWESDIARAPIECALAVKRQIAGETDGH